MSGQLTMCSGIWESVTVGKSDFASRNKIFSEQPHHNEAVIYVDITTATTQVDIRTLTPTYIAFKHLSLYIQKH